MEYIKNLLTGEKVEWLSLGDISDIKLGEDSKHLKKGKFPAYGEDGIMKYVDKFLSDSPSIIIPKKGVLDKVYFSDKAHWTLDTVMNIEIVDDIADPKFVFYYLLKENLAKYCLVTGTPKITEALLKKIPLPIPPISIQRKIVEVLDNFHKLFHPSIGKVVYIPK